MNYPANDSYARRRNLAARELTAGVAALAPRDQIPDCQVLGIPALPIASSIRRQASRASGCARKLLAIEFRNRHMSARFG